ncbi:uncharacterized protein [Chiloscyllium punctatum]|uniref:uncharacterized protein isoform X2 n=1 Tax=Chiloscyllium punctatum TaxID=137246 RepID=UPI003B635801
MKTILYLIYFMVHLPKSFSQSYEGCARDLLNNVDFPGNDIESVLAPDVNYCQKVCTEDSSCQFFTFLTRDWNTGSRRFYCYLKRTTTGQPTVKSNLQNVVSGYSLKHCGTQSSCFETVYDGLDFPGNDIRQSVVENEESCQRKCTVEADCQFFTFVKGEFRNERQRFLCYRKKSERGTPPKITILQNVVSGFPLRGCEGCIRDLLNNVDFPGNDIESVYAPDVNYCQKVCTEDSRCQFFTFLTRDWNTDTRRFYCYLKRTTTGQPTVKADLQNVVSGYSLKQCGTQFSCFETVYDGLDFPGNDIRQSVVENEESCQRKCTAEADCQFFTFVKGEFHNDRQRFLCYRKKSERGTPPKITILQNVVSGFPLRGCEGCIRDLLNNVDFPGNDIESVYAPDVNYCQKVCTEDCRCQFFTFLTRDWNTDTRRFYCYLKRTTTGQPTVKADLQNVVSGYSLKQCGTQFSCFETVYDGLDFPGNDIRQSVVENEESCQRKCTAEADCQFFTFVKGEFHNDRQRFLCYRKKSERGTPPKITILQNVVSGFPLRGCEGCARDLLNNVDFPGNDIESVYAPDVNYCQKVCTEDSRCQFFTFLTKDWNTDTRRFYCYLKRTTTGQPTVKADLQNVVSGYSLKQCGTQFSCFETVYDGLDFPGNDIRQSVVENEESCQRKCTAEADCQFFTFVKGEFHSDRQRFLCYRKKSERGTPPKITILQNVVSGFPLRGCEGCIRDLLNNVDIPGNDIETVYAPDVNYCQKVCTEDSRCQFFTFLTKDWNTDTRRFYCYLKRTTTGQPTVKTDLQNVVSGYSLKQCGTQFSCFETVYDGLDFPGNDIRQSVVENEESCQRKCTAEADCQFFTFVKGEFHNDRQRFLCYRKKSERGTPPKITILQNVVSGFPLRGCEGCVRDLLNNVDFPGNDIESVYAPDVNYCQKVCTEDSRCQFFTFLTKDWNTDTRRFYCYLKRTTTGQPTVKTDLQNVVSGYSLKQCGTQFSCFETVYDGLDFPGNDIRQSVVENEESCQRKCTAEADCQFFTFVKGEFHNDRQRFLCYRKKSERGTPPKITILQNVVSGFPLRGCEGSVRDLLSNVDFPGNDIESVYAPDVNYCQKVCTESSQCQFFTFLTRDWNTNDRRFYCYLKRTTTGQPTVKSDLENVVSGYSLEHCGPQSSCFETVYDGLDFPGNDIHQSVVEDEESCQRKCTEESDCQFFTFVKGEFHNDRQRYLCYRKKSERGTPPRITILQNVVSGFSLRKCGVNNSD